MLSASVLLKTVFLRFRLREGWRLQARTLLFSVAVFSNLLNTVCCPVFVRAQFSYKKNFI